MTLKKMLGWPIQAFFWLEWGGCGPNHALRVIRRAWPTSNQVPYFGPTEKEGLTAGPSATLGSGRDDNFVAGSAVVVRNHRFQNEFVIPTGAQRSGGTCC